MTSKKSPMSLFDELKRRNVFRVGAAYVATAWLLLQVMETVFPLYGLPDAAIRIVLTLFAIGFIPALVFAWAFERTPEGLKREQDVDRSRPITGKSAQNMDRIIIAILVLALSYFVYDKFSERGIGTDPMTTASRLAPNRAGQEAGKSIAVLPFANMSGDPDTEPFTQGIHDDLLTQLSHIRSLRVTSRTSVMQYKDTIKTIPVIAEELGVSNILEGGIQRSGDRVRINMQLIDANTDEHLWAEVYVRELTAENLFAVQAEIATEVTRSMQATLLPAEQSALDETPTQSMAAYDLYLIGRYHWHQNTAESVGQAREHFARAIEEDPDYALALSGLSDSYALEVFYGNLQGKDAFPLAQDAVDRAMALDDSLSEVWSSKGLLLLFQQDWPSAATTLEQALELDQQNFSAWLWYGIALEYMGRNEEQLTAYQNAYALEPMSLPVNQTLNTAYRHRGNFVLSRQHLERADQIDDLNPTSYKVAIARSYYSSGDLHLAIVDSRQILATDPGNVDAMEVLVDSYVVLGDISEAERWADQAVKVDTFQTLAYELYLVRSDFEGAIAYIEDKMALWQNRDSIPNQYMLFRAAYLGDQLETAKAYLAEYLRSFGGRVDINPLNRAHWQNLLVADFLIKHGDEEFGGAGRGREMLDEILSGLSNLVAQDFHHPNTWFGLAQAKAMQGDNAGASDALDKAVENGFREKLQYVNVPTMDSVRGDIRFQAISAHMDGLIAIERAQITQASLAPYTPLPDRELVIVPRQILEQYEGYYSDGDILINLFLDDNGRLMSRQGQERSFEMLAASDDEFYTPLRSGHTVKIHRDNDGAVTHIMVNHDGSVSRFKVFEPPPPAIQLERSVLERIEGSYAYHRPRGEQDGVQEFDIWNGVIYIDEDGKVIIDMDRRPRLEIMPYAETEFFMPGYDAILKFEINPETGESDRFSWLFQGLEYKFIRQ